MSVLLVRAARILTPAEEIRDGALLIEDGKVLAAGAREGLRSPPGASEIDLGNHLIIPGFVDLHIHGAGGHDVMEASSEALTVITRMAARNGTTTMLATTVTASAHETDCSLAGIAKYIASPANREPGRCEIAGIHLEGPFISAARRGVHPAKDTAAPSVQRLRAMCGAAGGNVRILTLAPELPGAQELIQYCMETGVIVSLGHTDATYEQATAAIKAGARQATHVFNAMRPFHQRDAGVLGAVLTDPRIIAELIADGVHVDSGAIRLLLATKGTEHILLVSDGTAATGMPDGNYRLGTLEVSVREGICRNEEGQLAGSTLTLDRALRTIVSLGVPLLDAVRMATSQPAAALGLTRKGQLMPGADADFVVLTPQLKVERVASRAVWAD
jgi:N-acetylglucosamine-6-phosphate deacetylase